jgi:hypothetical protein
MRSTLRLTVLSRTTTVVDRILYRGGARLTLPGALLLAACVVVSIFPEVVFSRGSYLPSDVGSSLAIDRGPVPTTSVYPASSRRPVTDGFRDIGAAAWQMEPAQHFMKRVIRTWQTPYWNPYAASGSLGPETLVDSKFSPISLAVALAGAGTDAFHAVTLLAFVLSTALLLITLRNSLGVPLFGAVAGSYMYWLNGFHISNLASQVTHPYVLAPAVLAALVALHERPTPVRFVLAVGAHVPILACTFVPTTALVLCSVHAIVLGYACTTSGCSARTIGSAALQLIVAVLALLLLAFMWLPILQSFNVVSLWDYYNAREFSPERFYGVVSLFSPKHFWESYSAFAGIRSFLGTPVALVRFPMKVYHLGVIPLLTVALLAGRPRWLCSPVVIAPVLLCLVSLGRIFGLPPFTQISQLPILRIFALPYWGVMTCLAASILFALSCRHLLDERARLWPSVAMAGALVLALVFLLGRLGLPAGHRHRSHLWFLVAVVVGFLLYLAAVRRFRWQGRGAQLLFVGMVFVELMFYVNTKRPLRRDHDTARPGFVAFLQANLGSARIVNVGRDSLYPDLATLYGIRQVGTMNSSTLLWYEEFYFQHIGREWRFLSLGRSRELPVAIEPQALDLLRVRYVVVDRYMGNYIEWFRLRGYPEVFADPIRVVFFNSSYQPLAYCAESLQEKEGIPDREGIRQARTLDGRLLALARTAGAAEPTGDRSGCSIERELLENGRLELKVQAPAPSVLVVSESWHPGWSAEVNGTRAYVGRVNQALRAVVIPEGTSRVVMTYDPPGLRSGVRITLASLVALIAACLFWHARTRGGRSASASASS